VPAPQPHVAIPHVAAVDPPKRSVLEDRRSQATQSVFGRLLRRAAIAAALVLCIAGAAFAWRSHSNNAAGLMRNWAQPAPGDAAPPRVAAAEPVEPATHTAALSDDMPTTIPASPPAAAPTIIVAAPTTPSAPPAPPVVPAFTASAPAPTLAPAIPAPAPAAASPAPPMAPPDTAQALSAMMRELTTLQQRIDELKAGLAELKNGQEQLNHEIGKMMGRQPEARPVEAHVRQPATVATRPAVVPQPRRVRPVTAAPLRPPPYYPPSLPQTPTPQVQTTAPQLLAPALSPQQPMASEEMPRPPMPVR